MLACYTWCYTPLLHADIRQHAQSHILAALRENKGIDQAQTSESAKDIEQHCFEMAVAASNARYAQLQHFYNKELYTITPLNSQNGFKAPVTSTVNRCSQPQSTVC